MMLAGVTITGGIEGTRISAILCVFDHHPPCRGKQKAVARVPRREDAVEHVDPSAHALEQVLWFTNPHEIARLVHRQLSSSMCHEIVHDVPWFTDAQTAYGKTALGVAQRAAAAGVPCIAVGGGVEPDGIEALAAVGAVAVPVTERPVSIEEAMAAGPAPLERCGERLARLVSVWLT